MPDVTPYKLGAIPSPVDHRDYTIQALEPARVAMLPTVIAYSNLMPVQDQGSEGACVGHALVGVLSYHIRKAGFIYVAARRDAYEGARLIEPVTGEGAIPRAALKNGQQTGLCFEATWPYVPEKPGTPGPSAPAERLLIHVASYASVGPDTTSMRIALATQDSPLFATIPVTDGFWQPDAQARVSAAGPIRGYHQVAIVGYDDTRQAFRMRNSWSAGWGDGGHCWYPYALAVTEAWTLKALVRAAPTPPPKPWWSFLFPWWS